jgi:hypothetical protein
MIETYQKFTEEEKEAITEIAKHPFSSEERQAIRNLIDITEKYHNALWLLDIIAKVGKWFIIIAGTITAYTHLPSIGKQ